MPFRSNSELPSKIKQTLPDPAMDIYRQAYNATHEQYHQPPQHHGNFRRDEVAHKVAWATVKKNYYRDDSGRWHLKENR